MLTLTFLISYILATTSVLITEPVDGETYDGDWLTIRAIVENENALPDSVHYTLNGDPFVMIPRLNTDWPTYMQNNVHHGYSESPAPLTNEVLWTAQVTGLFHEFPTPVVVDGIVYYPSNAGSDSLYALNSATGELIWKYYTGWTDDAVTVANGCLYTASDSIWCLDAYTGDRIWASGLADYQGSTPCVHDNKVVVGACIDWITKISHIYTLDAESGETVWDCEIAGNIVSCAAVSGEILYVPTYLGPLYAFNSENGDIIWSNSDVTDGFWDSSPVIVNEKLFIGGDNGTVYCFNAITGSLIWDTALPGGTPINSTPAVYEDMIITGSNGDYQTDGVISALNMVDGSVEWSISNSIHGSFGVADGIVFWGSSWNPYIAIFAADASTGNIIWEFDPNADEWGLQSSPSIVDGVMYYASTDGNLYAFGTGLKYTYLDDLYAEIGTNELIATSYDEGIAVAADTINFSVLGTGISTLEPPISLALCTNPNPFHSSTSISFELPESEFTSIRIFDLSGRIVSVLNSSLLEAGRHTIQWNGCNRIGQRVSAGLYLCRIQSGAGTDTIGLCLLR